LKIYHKKKKSSHLVFLSFNFFLERIQDKTWSKEDKFSN